MAVRGWYGWLGSTVLTIGTEATLTDDGGEIVVVSLPAATRGYEAGNSVTPFLEDGVVDRSPVIARHGLLCPLGLTSF